MNAVTSRWARTASTLFALVVGLSACYPNVPIARFQLINESPYEITFFAVAESEAGLEEAPNLLTSNLSASAVADADVDGAGTYWLRAVASVNGTPVTHTAGPMRMNGGTVGWVWAAEGDSVVASTAAADIFAQTTLPALLIDTNGVAVPDEPKINASLYVVDHQDGTVNRPTDTPTQPVVSIGIERRGYSTQTFPKASWGVEGRDAEGNDENFALLGLPEEEDWVLYGPWMDRSLIRNALGYELWGALGWYAPRTRFCEVYLHDDPSRSIPESYVGVYLLTEKIKRDKNRLDIKKLDPEDDAEPAITGGYLMEMREPDRLDPGEVAIPIRDGFVMTPVSPNSSKITGAQVVWFRRHIQAFEAALFGPDFRDPEKGYAPFIDTDSFVDYMLLQEFFKNRDAFHSSTFLYKDREDVIHMGPIWDLNIAMGYFSFQGIQGTDGWLLNTNGGPVSRSPWTARLLEDPAFAQRYQARWQELRNSTLSTVAIEERIDALVAQLNTAQARQFIRWPSLGMTLFPDINFLMFAGPHPDSYQGEIEYLKTWLEDRGRWIDEHIAELAR